MANPVGAPSGYTQEIADAICERIADGESLRIFQHGVTEIYGLYDPRDGSLRYIGKANNSQKRFLSHMRDAKVRDTPVYRWIRKLLAEGIKPIMNVMASVDSGYWQLCEREMIANARAHGERLLNVADGGDEPHCPEEVRAENGRKAAKARVSTIEKKAAQDLKYRANSSIKWLKESGQWDSERGLRLRAAMRTLARKLPNHFKSWEFV